MGSKHEAIKWWTYVAHDTTRMLAALGRDDFDGARSAMRGIEDALAVAREEALRWIVGQHPAQPPAEAEPEVLS